MKKDAYSITLTAKEWTDLLMILQYDDKQLAEKIIEQINEQVEKGKE